MLFGHETSFILRYGHQSGTIRIRKPFSIILDDQNQVPIGPYEGFYRNFEFFDKKSKKKCFFYCLGMFFRYVGGVWRGFRVTPDQKMMKKIFFWKKCFIRSEKARGPAGDRGKKFEKFSSRRITGPAGPAPDRHRPGPAC